MTRQIFKVVALRENTHQRLLIILASHKEFKTFDALITKLIDYAENPNDESTTDTTIA
jgi:hypothetical protein